MNTAIQILLLSIGLCHGATLNKPKSEKKPVVFVNINSVQSALFVYNKAFQTGQRDQLGLARDYISIRFEETLQSEFIVTLDAFALDALLAEKWYTHEYFVLEAMKKWIRDNDASLATQQALVHNVILTALSLKELAHDVYPTGIFDQKLILEAFIRKSTKGANLAPHLRYPNQITNDNIVTRSFGTRFDGHADCTTFFSLDAYNSTEYCYSRDYMYVMFRQHFSINSIEIIAESSEQIVIYGGRSGVAHFIGYSPADKKLFKLSFEKQNFNDLYLTNKAGFKLGNIRAFDDSSNCE